MKYWMDGWILHTWNHFFNLCCVASQEWETKRGNTAIQKWLKSLMKKQSQWNRTVHIDSDEIWLCNIFRLFSIYVSHIFNSCVFVPECFSLNAAWIVLLKVIAIWFDEKNNTAAKSLFRSPFFAASACC